MAPRFDPATIAIGVIGKAHGVHGEITLRLFNQIGPVLDELEEVILEHGGRREARAIAACRPCPVGLLVQLDGITSREQAAALTGSEVRVARETLPPLGPGEFYVADVPGCRVVTEDGVELGVVAETFWNGGQDVMVVQKGDGGGPAAEQLIPLVPDFVREVDTAHRLVRVAWEA